MRLFLAPSGRHFVRGHLLDLSALVLPLVRPLRVVRLVTTFARVNGASVSVRGRTTAYVVAAVTLFGFVAAIAVLDAERDSDGANIKSFGDAVWWAATTITTVAYGDQFPTTTQGRYIGVALMVGGIALAGTITAALASWFVQHISAVEQAVADKRDQQLTELLTEIHALRTQSTLNSAQVTRPQKRVRRPRRCRRAGAGSPGSTGLPAVARAGRRGRASGRRAGRAARRGRPTWVW